MNKILYLSGSIEFSNDPSSWRNHIEKHLTSHYKIINPASQFCPLDKADTDEYKKWVYDRFIIPDVQDVLRCSHFFIKIDKSTGRGSGTWGELTIAAYLNKKIIYWFDDISPLDIPTWALGCLYNSYKVESIDEAINYLKKEVE